MARSFRGESGTRGADERAALRAESIASGVFDEVAEPEVAITEPSNDVLDWKRELEALALIKGDQNLAAAGVLPEEIACMEDPRLAALRGDDTRLVEKGIYTPRDHGSVNELDTRFADAVSGRPDGHNRDMRFPVQEVIVFGNIRAVRAVIEQAAIRAGQGSIVVSIDPSDDANTSIKINAALIPDEIQRLSELGASVSDIGTKLRSVRPAGTEGAS